MTNIAFGGLRKFNTISKLHQIDDLALMNEQIKNKMQELSLEETRKSIAFYRPTKRYGVYIS